MHLFLCYYYYVVIKRNKSLVPVTDNTYNTIMWKRRSIYKIDFETITNELIE